MCCRHLRDVGGERWGGPPSDRLSSGGQMPPHGLRQAWASCRAVAASGVWRATSTRCTQPWRGGMAAAGKGGRRGSNKGGRGKGAKDRRAPDRHDHVTFLHFWFPPCGVDVFQEIRISRRWRPYRDCDAGKLRQHPRLQKEHEPLRREDARSSC